MKPAKDLPDFGAAIRRCREAQGINILEFAERCGLTPNYINTIERGLRRPSISTIVVLAMGLGMSVEELLERARKRAPLWRRMWLRLKSLFSPAKRVPPKLPQQQAPTLNFLGGVDRRSEQPSLSTVLAIAKGLHVSPAQLREGSKSKKTSAADSEGMPMFDDMSKESREAVLTILRAVAARKRKPPLC